MDKLHLQSSFITIIHLLFLFILMSKNSRSLVSLALYTVMKEIFKSTLFAPVNSSTTNKQMTKFSVSKMLSQSYSKTCGQTV